MMDNKYMPISLLVGVIAMVWVFVCNIYEWPSWAGFIGWSVYFYGGAKPEAIKTSGPGFLLGAFLAMAAVGVMGMLPPDNPYLAVIPVFFLSFLMTFAQNIDWFQIAPATFLGSATFFGTGDVFDTIVVGFLLGMVVLGLVTTYANKWLTNILSK